MVKESNYEIIKFVNGEVELELSTVKEILTVRLEGNRKVTRKTKYYRFRY